MAETAAKDYSEQISTVLTADGPKGLDVGTSNIVMAQKQGEKTVYNKQVNAFFSIPQSKFTRQILTKNEITFFEHKKNFYIIGDAAENFANMFNTNTKRPMELGLISAKEDEGIAIMQAIIKSLVQRPKKFGESICFSIPGPIIDDVQTTSTLEGHESVIKMYLESLGYTAFSINEGLAVVMAELAEDNYTGIGISIGGGLCNVCLSYMSVPVITYSLAKGGDYIDKMTSRDLGVPATHVKSIKEEGVDLLALPKNKMELALQVYYTDIINHLISSMQKVIGSSDKMPKITEPLAIVISGGTAKAKGFKERFELVLKSTHMPIAISSIRITKDPLNTTARGALEMALIESK